MKQGDATKQAYDTWIASLPAEQRTFVQGIMAIVMVMLDDRFNNVSGEVGRIARRQATNSERIAELQVRLDLYEQQQWDRATEAIEQFAAMQLPVVERDRLIGVLHTLVAEVEALKAKQLGESPNQAAYVAMSAAQLRMGKQSMEAAARVLQLNPDWTAESMYPYQNFADETLLPESAA